MKTKKTPKRKDTKEIIELKKVVTALNAVQHNPIAWGSVIALFAPIIARLATRIAVRYISAKVGKRFKKSLPDEAAEYVADRIGEAVSRLPVK